MILRQISLVFILQTFLLLVQCVSSESTISEKKVAPLSNSSSVNQSIGNVTKANEVASTTSTSTTLKPMLSTTRSTSTLPPQILNGMNNSESTEKGPSIKWSEVDIDDAKNNETLFQNNITKYEQDYHEYYNSTIITDQDNTHLHRASIYADCGGLNISLLLSQSHRRAFTLKLPFEFPFYGHPITNITVATGGFLYAGDYIHSWLAATQYISPLMANFDTSISNDSYVKHCEDKKSFHVFWERVLLQNKTDVGPFTFSASLYDTGDIVFAYYFLPIDITQIEDDKHPVKVGVSDAYIVDKTVYHARRKTIFEYHRVNFPGPKISNFTTIRLTPLTTCNTFTDCHSCLTADLGFKCSWCPTLGRCSSGVDRKRQEWTNHNCDKSQISDVKLCSAYISTTPRPSSNPNSSVTTTQSTDESKAAEPRIQAPVKPEHHSKFLSIIGVILCLVVAFIGWAFYAYTHPHSGSGQFLIQYGRPAAWTLRRGEARYTAATIHM